MSNKPNVSETAVKNLRPVAISVLTGVIACVAILIFSAAIISSQSVPHRLISPMVILSLIVGGFISGFLCSKAIREKGLVYGAVCGFLISLAMLLAGFVITEDGIGVLALIKIMIVMFSAMIGGVLGVNTRKKRKK